MKAHESGREISALELMEQAADSGLPTTRFSGLAAVETAVLKGRWCVHGEGPGLVMHCGEYEELSDVSQTLELPAGLSLSIVFEGRVDFALGGRRLHLGGHADTRVQCACYALDRPEMLTRFMRRGQKVRKLNLFVERAWLEQRLAHGGESAFLHRFFSHSGSLDRWEPSASVLEPCWALMRGRTGAGQTQQLRMEARMLELLARVLDEWALLVDSREDVPDRAEGASLAELVKARIDAHIGGELCLRALAQQHCVSVSTLQRHFKARFNTTVIGYQRRKQLERARAALVRDRLSIGEAAYLAGYNHVGNFIAAFRREFSLSPAKYRELHARGANRVSAGCGHRPSKV